MSYIKMSLGIALVFVLAGCAEPPPSGSGTAHNFTLLLACNGTALLNVSVTGNARIRNRDLADSNCSLHVSRDIVLDPGFTEKTSVLRTAMSPGFGKDRTVFASSPIGLFKSTDGGSSWSHQVPMPLRTIFSTARLVTPRASRAAVIASERGNLPRPLVCLKSQSRQNTHKRSSLVSLR